MPGDRHRDVLSRPAAYHVAYRSAPSIVRCLSTFDLATRAESRLRARRAPRFSKLAHAPPATMENVLGDGGLTVLTLDRPRFDTAFDNLAPFRPQRQRARLPNLRVLGGERERPCLAIERGPR